MNTLSFIRLGTAGRGVLLSWSPLVVVGSLLAACDDDDRDNQPPFATVGALPMTRVMTTWKSEQVYFVDNFFFKDPDQDV